MNNDYTLHGDDIHYKGKHAGAIVHRQHTRRPGSIVNLYVIDLTANDLPLASLSLNGKTADSKQRAFEILKERG